MAGSSPLDKKIIMLPDNGKSIITVEDHAQSCGFGSAVLESIFKQKPKAGIQKPITVLGVPDEFIKHDSRQAQLNRTGINADKIVQTAKALLKV